MEKKNKKEGVEEKKIRKEKGNFLIQLFRCKKSSKPGYINCFQG